MKTKQSGKKVQNCRHGHGSRRSCNAVEKAIETVARRERKRLCRDWDSE